MRETKEVLLADVRVQQEGSPEGSQLSAMTQTVIGVVAGLGVLLVAGVLAWRRGRGRGEEVLFVKPDNGGIAQLSLVSAFPPSSDNVAGRHMGIRPPSARDARV